MKFLSSALVAVPAAVILFINTAWGQRPPETVTIKKEFEFNDASKVTGSDWQTPLATYNDVIYYVYVNRQLKTLIVKKSSDGTVSKNVIFEETDSDPWHNGASVGIDRNGYILATDLLTASLYANPRQILDPISAARRLHKVLPDVPEKQLLAKLTNGRAFIWLKRNLTPKQQNDVFRLAIPGVWFQPEQA